MWDNFPITKILKRQQKHENVNANVTYARFVRWLDGSLHSFMMNEVFDLNIQDTMHDWAHDLCHLCFRCTSSSIF